MNILIINGSPHVKGTSALLMEEFIRGAQEKGHTIHVLPVIPVVQQTMAACLRMEWKS